MPVSYTHLDVYKRQHTHTHTRARAYTHTHTHTPAHTHKLSYYPYAENTNILANMGVILSNISLYTILKSKKVGILKSDFDQMYVFYLENLAF